MYMLTDTQIADADLTDWRKLGQGLHARYRAADFAAAARFVAAVAEEGQALGHSPRVTLSGGSVDLKLISTDAIFRDGEGVEHVVEWVTARDLDLAARISSIAGDQGLAAEPGTIATVELALDTAHTAAVAPVWSALLTGGSESQGRGTLGDDVRDVSGQTPILWFQDTDEHETPRQRFHLDVWVPPEVADERIAAAVAAGATIVDASQAPSYTVLADPDGNKACVCSAQQR